LASVHCTWSAIPSLVNALQPRKPGAEATGHAARLVSPGESAPLGGALGCWQPENRSCLEWVEDIDACRAEISDVAGDNSQAMRESGGRNQAVLDGHRCSSSPHRRKNSSPAEAGLTRPVQAGDAANAAVKPVFQPLATPTRRQQVDPESQLTENDGVDCNCSFIPTKPIDDRFIGLWLCGLAEDICINEVFHGNSQVVG